MRTVPSNSSISYGAYCTECCSRGRQQERPTVCYGDEKEMSNAAKKQAKSFHQTKKKISYVPNGLI